MIPRESDFVAKQETTNGDDSNSSKASSSSSWSRLKDPRIVRVSRAMGGKDRHSKVCTVRGLRDRRVRLSVQTAIQLYDLQERLGVNQPSKVVDWLLDAAKHEIDELPPLQIPQGTSFTQMHHHLLAGNEHHHEGGNYNQLATNNHLMSSYSSFGRWDPSNLTLSQAPISLGLAAHQDQDLQNFSVVYQSTGPYFTPPSNAHPSFHSSDLSTSSLTAPMDHSTARPFDFNITADLLPSENNAVNEQAKRDDLN